MLVTFPRTLSNIIKNVRTKDSVSVYGGIKRRESSHGRSVTYLLKSALFRFLCIVHIFHLLSNAAFVGCCFSSYHV